MSFSQFVTFIVLIYICDLCSISEGVVDNIYTRREKKKLICL
jgi:hypothetical protein